VWTWPRSGRVVVVFVRAVALARSLFRKGISWNYTTWLNIVFLVLAAVLLVRFFRTGGRDMLRMMGGSPDVTAQHGTGR
jgi:uncharacterized membrane protein YraQ (UPF0718 family)